MGILFGIAAIPLAFVSLIVGLIIAFFMNKILRKNYNKQFLDCKERIPKKTRHLINFSEFFLDSFLAVSMWAYSWPALVWAVDKGYFGNISGASSVSSSEQYLAPLGRDLHALLVYSFVLGLIPGIAAIIGSYIVKKIAATKFKSVLP
jgi:di/tricarboxylate transporter